MQDRSSRSRPRAIEGGAGFDAQWDAGFLYRVRAALVASDDADRDIAEVVVGILGEGRGQPLSRVIYTESHDEVANGRTRVPEAISPGDADNWWAKKRAVLGSALVLTSPGIPMLFQGQELLEDRWFDDTVALDWEKASTNRGILRLHRDLIALRRARDGTTRGLRGSNVAILRADQEAKVLAMHRWMDGGPHDDTVVVANFADRTVDDLWIGFPAAGRWNVRFNSDASTYDPDFGEPRHVRSGCRRAAARWLRPERSGVHGTVQRGGPVPRGLRTALPRPRCVAAPRRGADRRRQLPSHDHSRCHRCGRPQRSFHSIRGGAPSEMAVNSPASMRRLRLPRSPRN